MVWTFAQNQDVIPHPHFPTVLAASTVLFQRKHVVAERQLIFYQRIVSSYLLLYPPFVLAVSVVFPGSRTGHFYLSQILASHTCRDPRTCHDNRYSISYRLSVNHSVVLAHNTHYQYWNEAIAGKSVFVARPGSWHGHLGASATWHRGVAPTPTKPPFADSLLLLAPRVASTIYLFIRRAYSHTRGRTRTISNLRLCHLRTVASSFLREAAPPDQIKPAT